MTLIATAFDQSPHETDAARRGAVVQVDYCGAARPGPMGRRCATETMYGPTAANALRQICRQLGAAPDELRAADFIPPTPHIVIAALRDRVWTPAAIIRGGFTVDSFNATASKLAGEGWRP